MKKINTETNNTRSAPIVKIKTSKSISDFPIVGIGASAGGLEALEQFFGKMPIDTGMAFVIIQHLAPDYVEIMPEILQRITKMKVQQASDALTVEPNNLYVIPPNKSMTILNGALHLFHPTEIRGLRLPIDVFFRSLAEDQHERAIGIILSGMGSDGSLGLKEIQNNNGVILVQDPNSSDYDSMPNSAIKAINADIVATPEVLPSKLIEFLKIIPSKLSNDAQSVEVQSKDKSNLDKLLILLRNQTGHDFSLYKKNTLFRRIERRKNIHQIDKIQNYIRFCQENPKEVEILFKELLIGVTNFFRDPLVWEKLKEDVLPELFSQFSDGYVVRAWVSACSTGEEAYSLAIIFKEILDNMNPPKHISMQIFATDLDSEAIEIARNGMFPTSIANDVSPERLSRFFMEEGENYRINPVIREMVVFAPQNIIKDPPFTKVDVLTNRNMLIYMEPELQKKLLSLFNYSLNPGGIMVLGTSETLGNNVEGFEELDIKLKIYKRTLLASANPLIDFPSSFHKSREVRLGKKSPQKIEENIQMLADQFLLQSFAPPSVLTNDKGDIIYITGRTGKYLEPVAGKANWNIYAMARNGLRELLPVALRKVMQNYEPLKLRNIKVGTNGGTQIVDVTLQRIENPESIRGMIMIVFADVATIIEQTVGNFNNSEMISKENNQELEIELRRCRQELQGTLEEMQTSQEELKSTNEELQSTNEELQSTNEELTTSKEEMQSLNEELQTVNAELQSKVTDYIQSNNDMKNLLNSTEIATLFLDKQLNIRRFTDSVINIIKLRKTDIGRPFTDLVTELQYPDIDTHSLQVLKTLITIETPITTKDGKWYNVRIMPYRTFDDHIDGLVITFTDITSSKNIEIELNKAIELLKAHNLLEKII